MNALKTAILENFAQVKDPRKHHSPPHLLLEIITLTLCAVIYGADGWVAVEQFGQANESWLRRFLRLPNGIPSHDTLGDVFAAIAPAAFEAAFRHWTRTVSRLSRGQIEPFDVQTFPCSPDGRLGKQAIRMIRAWADQNPLLEDYLKLEVLSNETTTVSSSPDPLELTSSPVMLEAQDWPAGDVPARNDQRGYWFGLEHWRWLFEDTWPDPSTAFAREPERYGRFAPYRGLPLNDPAARAWNPQHAGMDLPSLANVEAQPWPGEKRTTQPRFDLSSLSAQARPFNQALQTHGQIKNKGQIVLDITCWTDDRSLRQGHSIQNLRFGVPLPARCTYGNPMGHSISAPNAFKPLSLKRVDLPSSSLS